MENSPKLRVFLDTSALIAGIASVTGVAREVLRLAEMNLIDIVVSRQVLVEADRNISSKLGELLADYRAYIKDLSPELVDDPSSEEIKRFSSLINQNDAPILAAAELTGADYLITWDRKHFISGRLKSRVKIRILTPGEFLREFKIG